ncbi:MAG: cytochrome-c peroxidase [Blastocatellales bacterium]
MTSAIWHRWATRVMFTGFVAFAIFAIACENKPAEPVSTYTPEILPLPAGLEKLEAMEIPASNPMTPEKVALGRQLFFDTRLSFDGSRSCYSCHVCEKGLTDGLPKAVGAGNKQLTRSSPTLWNIGYHKEFYWDGRSKSLEAQGKAAWQGGNMGAKDHETEILAKINGNPGYKAQFQKVFGSDATADNIFQAIAAYERTIINGNDETPFDRWQVKGDQSAVSDQVKRGYEVFKKAKCDQCHAGHLFTDLQYHNVGIGMDAAPDKLDKGRFAALKDLKDDDPEKLKATGAFKTPTLRDIAKSAPYFHDGSVATLEEAVDLMTGGGKPNKYLDTANLKKANLTKVEKEDLIAFLKSLSTDKCNVTEPKLP